MSTLSIRDEFLTVINSLNDGKIKIRLKRDTRSQDKKLLVVTLNIEFFVLNNWRINKSRKVNKKSENKEFPIIVIDIETNI